ncbi:hypothetical protein CC1G_14393 [Coprinopsis cinerea okayama7|uniref:Cytoplasmic tRNA 2-thiolation protein 2 n=1 Tax=Coprinopsis cinerea (strain Okayama-7 / 130 / ATCC MYA-4618 / FGSC 9003) TaxID=240176 RepID=D6RM89_COPC7|nr:hypothetical protein CC1G_14393 [Coprinopsis cinerea okayama7\|eukprot:XP_002911396.1 hypothetical protein CC1G_14393 [Coprinopsis cinerea okayama7\
MSTSCGNPAVEKDAEMTRRPKFDRSKQCVKCKEQRGNIVIRHAVYCKQCFFPLIVTRFKKTLEPVVNPKPDGPRKKALKANGSLVIGFSGGLGSSVLLDLVSKTYFSGPPTTTKENGQMRGGAAHPKNRTGADSGVWKGKPAVCYVELASVIPEGKDKTEEVRKTVQRYSASDGFEFEFVPLRIEDAFDDTWWARFGGIDLSTAARSYGADIADELLPLSEIPSSSSTPYTPVQALQTYLSYLPTPTAKESAIQTLTRLLLLHVSASRDASHLLLGTSLTTLSVNLIAGISQGAGFSVSEESFEEWSYPTIQRADSPSIEKTRPSKVRIVRPLRDIGIKECGFWMWWSGLPLVGEKRLSSGRQSIVSLTRDFIMGLEQDYPSTEWKAQISIRSYTDETFAAAGHPLPPHLEDFPPAPTSSVDPPPHIASRLCYACHTTLTSRSSRGNPGRDGLSNVVPLPTWSRASLDVSGVSITRKLGEKEMMSQIQDYLLEE